MSRGSCRPGLFALLALLALAGLSGCVHSSGADRYSATAGTSGTQGGGGQQFAAAGPGSYQVVSGDTLYGISRRSGVPLRAIIEANGLQPPYDLKPGQVLRIPQVQSYTVQAGDTVYGISRRFGVEASELARQNDIAPPFTISPGQVLLLPHGAAGGGGGQVAAAPTPAPAPLPAPAPVGSNGNSGGGAGGGVTATPLPPTGGQPQPAPQPAGQAGAPQPITPPVASTPPTPQPAPQPTPQPTGAPAGPAVLPEPPARAGTKFIWPVDGTVVSSYGPKAGGLHNDGINIAAPKGSPVKAAENGVVAYTGSELKGFGNLVLIKHQGDYVTAYAHNDQVLVKRGDIVRRGQTIARVGSTGSVDTPQLHFEIRKGSRAIEPTAEMTTPTAGN